jgi:hypothetical protein
VTDTDPFAVMAEHAGHTDAPDGSGCIQGTNLDQKNCSPWFVAYDSPPVRLVRRVADEIREYFPEGDDRSLEWAAQGAIGALLEEGWSDAETLAEVRVALDKERAFSGWLAEMRERERAVVADVWDAGFAAGKESESDAYWSAGNPVQTANPYRQAPDA